MFLTRIAPVAGLLALMSSAWADQASDLATFKAATRAQYDQTEQAYNRKDADTLVENLFSDEAIVVPPGPHFSVGREQILAGYKAHLDGKMHLASFKAHVNGNSGWEFVNSTVTADDPKEKPATFRVLFLWEKQQGHWRCVGEMFMPGDFPVNPAGEK